MADHHITTGRSEIARHRDRYYDAPTTLKPVPGVTRKVCSERIDEFTGTAEALAAAGLLPLDRFPGMPGQNMVSAELRPRGVARLKEERVKHVPGHLFVRRQINGQYLVLLAVSRDEQARRRDAREACEKAAEEAREDVLKQVPAHRHKYLESLDRPSARRYFCDKTWLAKSKIDPATARMVLEDLEIFDEADKAREIELSLRTLPMSCAKALIARVGGACD